MRLKLISLVFTLWLACSHAALADWNPTFDPNKHVYIDPALQQHPAAPIGFEQQLTRELAEYKGTNYYVVAIQSGRNPQGGIGVAKTDDIVKAWVGLNNFPVDDYAIVVWARRQSDPSKGGFGKNVSANLSWAKALDIKPIFKPLMPQNPRGAVLAIVRGVDGSIKAQAVALTFGKIFAAGVSLWIFGFLLKASGLAVAIDNWRTRKERASVRLLRLKLAATSVSRRLLEIDPAGILTFYTQIYPDNLELQSANKNHLDLAALCVKFNAIVTLAESLLADDAYQKVLNLFGSSHQIDVVGDGDDRTYKFNSCEHLLISIEMRIGALKQQIMTIEAAKGNVQAPPKPKPAPARPSSPSPGKPAAPPSRSTPARVRSASCISIDNRSYRSPESSYWDSDSSTSDDSSSGSSSGSSDWGSSGSDYDSSGDGGDY